MWVEKFYFDVTQLVHWQGEPTGIPRVMKELAVRFAQNKPDTKFISWVKEIQAFCEVDLRASLGHGPVYIQTDSASAKVNRRPLAATAKKAAKVGIRISSKFAPGTSNKVEAQLKQTYFTGLNKVNFKNGDRLFIPWGEWWDENFIAHLETEHKVNKLNIIQLIHDMGPIVIPQFSGAGGAGGSTVTFPSYCRRILPICELVLAVSNNTKKDINEWLSQSKLDKPKVEVFRLGDDLNAKRPNRPTNIAAKDLKTGNFILTVGTIEARKNHFLLYYVYKLAQARGIELPKLVIAGRLGWGTEDVVQIMKNDPDLNGKIIFLHGLTDAEISWLYSNCMFTVIPSFYEGWGIPIAESISRGVPCLCSNTSSMVEIAEGIVGHFSPLSSEECLNAIVKWLDPKKLAKARKKTNEYRPHTWGDSYKQVREYIMELR